MSDSTRLIEAMNRLQDSAKYSDLTLACQGQEFHVHRAIVCPHSKFFEAACDGDFEVWPVNPFIVDIRAANSISRRPIHIRLSSRMMTQPLLSE